MPGNFLLGGTINNSLWEVHKIKPPALLAVFDDSSGGLSAWEMAARYSEFNRLGQRTLGTRESNITLVVNCYLSRYTRLMANYILVETNLNLTGQDEKKDKANIFAMRVQIEF